MADKREREKVPAEMDEDLPILCATFVDVDECPGCGDGTIILMDEEGEVFAEAHFPKSGPNGEDWLEDVFIPKLRAARATRGAPTSGTRH